VANHASAIKRARQDEKIRALHRTQKSTMRTAIKAVHTAIAAGDQAVANEALKTATSLLARAGRKNMIHSKQAARRVSRLNTSVKAMSV